jgi:nucleoid DNA-binding protein
MSTVTKKELVERITQETQARQALVKNVVQEVLDGIAEELAKGNRLEFRDFGVFETRVSAPRKANNPKTLERVDVPAKRRVKFRPGRLMREGLNSKFAG